MYPLGRLIQTTIRAVRSPSLNADDEGVMHFRCMPWDIDMFMEMNNGRILTLYDLGRFDLSIRTGLAKVLKEKNWGLVVASSTIRYRRRIRVFDRVTMHTRLAGFDGRWVYIQQSMWVKGQPASSVLLRTGVTEGGKVIDSARVRQSMNLPEGSYEPTGWVKEWIETEDDRPWPPDQAHDAAAG